MGTWTRACLGMLAVGLVACTPGYEQVDGEWVWVSYNEGDGRTELVVEADASSFEVLSRGFARDRDAVFFQGVVLEDAESESFSVVGGSPTGGVYARDDQRVYYDTYTVLGADPESFRTLTFPYARDAREAYCGTVPLGVRSPRSFEVVEGSRGFAGGFTIDELEFLAPRLREALLARGLPPEARVLVATELDGVWARAQAEGQQFRGCEPVEPG